MIHRSRFSKGSIDWENMLLSLTTHLDKAVAFFDGELNVWYGNQAMASLLKKPLAGLHNVHLFELFPALSDTFFLKSEPFTLQIGGNSRECTQLTIIPLNTADGMRAGGAIMAHPMNPHPAHEAGTVELLSRQLVREKQFTEMLINTSLNGIVVIDKDWRYTAWNPVIEQMTGLAKAEVIGRQVFEVFPGMENTAGGQAFQRALSGEKVYLNNQTYPQTSGVYDSFAAPIYNDNLEIVGALAVFHDVTERKHTEEKLEDSLHFIRRIADATPGILFVYDLLSGQPTFISRGLSATLGYTLADIQQMGDQLALRLIHPDDLARVRTFADQWQAARDGELCEAGFRLKDIRGEWRWLGFRLAVFKRTGEGEPAQLIGIALDETNRKRVEEELRQKTNTLNGILANLPMLVIRINQSGTITEASGKGLRSLGMIDDELVGVNVFESYPHVSTYIRQALAGQAVSYLGTPEYLGEKKFFLNHFFYDPEDACVVGFAIDVTGEKEAEARVRQLNEELELRIAHRTSELEAINEQLRQEIAERKLYQDALRRSEERYEMAARASHDIIWDWNLLTDELTYNENYYHILGYTAGEVIPGINEWYQGIHPDDRERVVKGIRDVIRGEGRFWEDEYRHRRKDGTYAIMLDRGYLLRSSDGKPVRMVGAMRDVTARKQAEAEIRRSEQHYRELTEAMPSIIWMATADGREEYYNQQWMDFSGLSLEQTLAQGWLSLIHPDDRAEALRVWTNAIAIGQGYQVEQRVRRHDGEYRWLLVHALPLRDENGEVIRWLGTAMDIHARKQAEAMIQQSEERFRLVARATNDAIYDLDLVNKRGWQNEAGNRLLGFERTDIDSGCETWKERLHPDFRDKVPASLRRAIEQGKDQWVYEYPYRKPDGTYAHILDRCHIIRDAQGTPVRMVGSMADLTDLKQAQRELERQALELKRSNQELEQFAYIVSHDLQEPLRTVTGFAGILKKKLAASSTQEVDEILAFIVDAADRMKQLIRSLLEYSRIGTAEVKLAPTDFNEVLDQVNANLQRSIRETNADVQAGPLPTLPADQTQMIQLLQNLVSNAIKFRSENPLRISIDAREQSYHWQFSVRDTGIGMDMKFAQKIFQVFQRLHSRAQYEGTGIGLATCKKIVERHGGQIWVESVPGEGSVFYFTLRK
jgi:PAS domain S-box-containing protein